MSLAIGNPAVLAGAISPCRMTKGFFLDFSFLQGWKHVFCSILLYAVTIFCTPPFIVAWPVLVIAVFAWVSNVWNELELASSL